MGAPNLPNPDTANAPDAAPNTAPMVIPTVTGATAPMNSPQIFPNLPLMSHFNLSPPPLHFNGPSAFPTSLGGFFDDTTTSNLPIGTFDPYHTTNLATTLVNNSTSNVGPSMVAQRPTASTSGVKRSLPKDISEGDREPKRRKETANCTVTQPERIYQAFQVGRTEAGRSVITSVQNRVAGEANADQFPGTGM